MTSSRRSTAPDVTLIESCDDNRYPEALKVLGDLKPPRLYCRGNLELLNTRSLALIGARDSTEYGDSVAEMLATDLARAGVTLISGLARGIDSIAHRCALEHGSGTIAVLGCGIDVIYPHSNARLQERIANEGLLISEFEPGAPAMRHHFPQRNRIIALLGEAVLVVEAGPKSGTRITVDWALDHQQTVLAVPGPIGRHASQGTNEILRDGGHIITCSRDIFEILNWTKGASAAPEAPPRPDIADATTAIVFDTLDATARHIDEIARRSKLPARDTLLHLLDLELGGLAVQHPGKRFAKAL